MKLANVASYVESGPTLARDTKIGRNLNIDESLDGWVQEIVVTYTTYRNSKLRSTLYLKYR